MCESWYVIRTVPRSEFLAAAELEREGWRIFCPRVKIPSTGLRRADHALFPGYIFLRCDLDKGSHPALSQTGHVVGWVRFERSVPAVPDEVIEELAARIESVNRNGGYWTRFEPGQKVRVASRVMESLAQVVEDSGSPQGRVKVLLEFMGRLVSAQVPREDLRPIEVESDEKHPLPRRTRGSRRWIQGFGPQVTTA